MDAEDTSKELKKKDEKFILIAVLVFGGTIVGTWILLVLLSQFTTTVLIAIIGGLVLLGATGFLLAYLILRKKYQE